MPREEVAVLQEAGLDGALPPPPRQQQQEQACRPDGQPQQEVAEEPALVPLVPWFSLPPPSVVPGSCTQVSAVFVWHDEVQWGLPPHDARQASFQQRVVYSRLSGLELQQATVGPPDPGAPIEPLLAAVAGVLREDAWSPVTMLQGGETPVTGLRPGRFYAARVRTVGAAVVDGNVDDVVSFQPAFSAPVPFRSAPAPPSQCQAPMLAQRARTSLKLKWGVPNDTGGEVVTEYQLLASPAPPGYEDTPADEEGCVVVYAGAERSFKLSRLSPGQCFAFKVRAHNPLGCSPWSLASSFTTQASVPLPPEPPLQVAATKDTTTVRWQAPCHNGSPISCYQLEVDNGRGGDFRLAYAGSELGCVVTKLASGRPYRFRVRAENQEGWGLWSAVSAAATAATVPGSPEGLGAVGINRTSATLAWSPPERDGGSPVLRYQVELQPKTRVAVASMGADWLRIYEGDALATTFSALQAGCEYLVRVAACNAAGWGAPCIAKHITTAADKPQAPPAPSAEPGPTSLVLRWQPPPHDGGAPVSGYRVELRCANAAAVAAAAAAAGASLAIPDHFVCLYNGEPGERCLYVTDLLPGTQYEFRAAAQNSQGGSEWSLLGCATTLAAPPLPPAAPVLEGASAHSLSVRWAEPYCQGAPVTSYTLHLARLASSSGCGEGGDASGCAAVPAAPGGGCGSARTPRTSDSGLGEPHHEPHGAGSGAGGAPGRLRWEVAYSGPATAAEVSKLQPAARYALRLRAHNSEGGSAWGEALVASTGAAAPERPVGLVVEALGSSRLRLAWCPPLEDHGSPVQGYQADVAPAVAGSGSLVWARAYEGREAACELRGLAPGRRYKLRVRSRNGRGWGEWAEPVEGTTLAAPPGAPGKLSVSQRSANALRLKWALPRELNGAPVSSYAVAVRMQQQDASQEQGWQLVAGECTELALRVADLRPGSSYELRVAAANSQGQGTWSEPVAAATLLLPPQPPEQLAVQLLGGPEAAAASRAQPELAASWAVGAPAPLHAEAVAYELEAVPVSTGGGKEASSSPAVRASIARSTHGTLQVAHGHTYALRVRAVGAEGSGHSAWSAAVQVAVPAGPPASAATMEHGERAEAAGKATKQRHKAPKVAQAQQPDRSEPASARSKQAGAAARLRKHKSWYRALVRSSPLAARGEHAVQAFWARYGSSVQYLLMVVCLLAALAWMAAASAYMASARPGSEAPLVALAEQQQQLHQQQQLEMRLLLERLRDGASARVSPGQPPPQQPQQRGERGGHQPPPVATALTLPELNLLVLAEQLQLALAQVQGVWHAQQEQQPRGRHAVQQLAQLGDQLQAVVAACFGMLRLLEEVVLQAQESSPLGAEHDARFQRGAQASELMSQQPWQSLQLLVSPWLQRSLACARAPTLLIKAGAAVPAELAPGRMAGMAAQPAAPQPQPPTEPHAAQQQPEAPGTEQAREPGTQHAAPLEAAEQQHQAQELPTEPNAWQHPELAGAEQEQQQHAEPGVPQQDMATAADQPAADEPAAELREHGRVEL